jgi:hypothetical protein
MQGITIGLPTVSRHLWSAGFPDCERAGLANNATNARIEKAIAREKTSIKRLLLADMVCPPLTTANIRPMLSASPQGRATILTTRVL